MSLDRTHYHVAILSTGLPNAILSAALSAAGLAVIHLDHHDYYADTWASLTLSELTSWASQPQPNIDQLRLTFPAASPTQAHPLTTQQPPTIPHHLAHLDRHYAISLAPSLIPATGPSIDTLVASNVAAYATFRLLEHTAVYIPSSSTAATLARVPSSKEDVFKTKSLSLIAKRRLMKLLLHIASDQWDADIRTDPELAASPFPAYLARQHSLPPDLVDAIAYGVALCPSPTERTDAALARARKHLQSIGRYGNSAYLVGQYGGAGEVAQGYCRASAVKGGTFILNHRINSVVRQTREEEGTTTTREAWKIDVSELGERITADVVVATDEILEALGVPGSPIGSSALAQGESSATQGEGESDTLRAILVLDRPIDFEASTREPETATQANEDAPTDEGGSSSSAAAPPTPTPPETGLLVLPPSTVGDGPHRNANTITVLMMGEGTFSCPKGQYVYYLQTQSCPAPSGGTVPTAEEALRPAVELVLSLAAQARFGPTATESTGAEARQGDKGEGEGEGKRVTPHLELFYRRTSPSSPSPAATAAAAAAAEGRGKDEEKLAISIPSYPHPSRGGSTTTSGDWAVTTAESAYYDVLARLSLLPSSSSSRLGEGGVGRLEVARERIREGVKRKMAGRRRRRHPEEYRGRGGRGEGDGVLAEREEREEREEEGKGEEGEEEEVVLFFEKEEEEGGGEVDDE